MSVSQQYKSFVLGHTYLRLRAPHSYERFRYLKSVGDIQKMIIDRKLSPKKPINRDGTAITIPIVLHKNDLIHKNINLSKFTKMLMYDSALSSLNIADQDSRYKFKFVLNDLNNFRSDNKSLVSTLNKISNRPDIPAEQWEKYRFNRANQIALYLNYEVDPDSLLLDKQDHLTFLNKIEQNLNPKKNKIVEMKRQFYVDVRPDYSKNNSNPIFSQASKDYQFDKFKIQCKLYLTNIDFQVKVSIDLIELIEEVKFFGVNRENKMFKELIHSYVKHPITGKQIKIIEIDENFNEHNNDNDNDSLIALIPSHYSKHYDYLVEKNLINDTDISDVNSDLFQYNNLIEKRKELSLKLGFEEPQIRDSYIIPIALRQPVIKNMKNKSFLELTNLKMIDGNFFQELKTSILEASLVFFDKKNKNGLKMLVTNEPRLVHNFLECLEIPFEDRIKIVEVPTILDYKDRDISKMRPDFNKAFNGEPIDQLSENFNNKFHLFKEFPKKSLTASFDQIRGLLLSPLQQKIVDGEDVQNRYVIKFDDFNKNLQFIRLTMLYSIFNNYQVSFATEKPINDKHFSCGFTNILYNNNDDLKPWNYFMIFKLLSSLKNFMKFQQKGLEGLVDMNETFNEVLILINNSYIDLLNSEIMLNKTETSRDLSFCKNLMGTIIYYLNSLSKKMYNHEFQYILKRVPAQNKKYYNFLNKDLEKFDINLDHFNKNEISGGGDTIKNYNKIFDRDILDNGSMLIQLVDKIKEILILKDSLKNLKHKNYSVVIEINDLVKFLTVQEHLKYLNIVYAKFKNDSIFKNNKLKLVHDLNKSVLNTKKFDRQIVHESYYGAYKDNVIIHLLENEAESEVNEEQGTVVTNEKNFYEKYKHITFKDVYQRHAQRRNNTSSNSSNNNSGSSSGSSLGHGDKTEMANLLEDIIDRETR
ncbi:hypothetical protein PACTADRAFT_75543 [Pachysolen tannophilus NRRL Y-2460]|uniref:Uncharacterized protein n=1 Tax=Pachysolen tannophilus NRRL Y-2460 TaxID=669874 RepID=A0A1E4TX98_PACTA|nr:hypothetical protein PACTADRAFT_75543 [Pachysolen tannophilus NRRL Y-2460]